MPALTDHWYEPVLGTVKVALYFLPADVPIDALTALSTS
jgi:hypothetical protein